MHQVAGTLPPWAVYILLLIVTALASLVFKIIFNRYERLESRVDGIETKTELHITEDRHQRDLENIARQQQRDLEKIASRHESALEKIADKHDKELNNVHTRIDDSFERLEARITDSHRGLQGRLDDLHAVLLNILSKNRDDM